MDNVTNSKYLLQFSCLDIKHLVDLESVRLTNPASRSQHQQ